MLAHDEIVVFITAPNEEEAAGIARALVQSRLAACVNIIKGVRSIYRWRGKLEDAPEVLMIAKTQRKLFGALAAKTRELHSYDIPEIIALPLAEGSKDYLKWLRESTEIKTEE